MTAAAMPNRNLRWVLAVVMGGLVLVILGKASTDWSGRLVGRGSEDPFLARLVSFNASCANASIPDSELRKVVLQSFFGGSDPFDGFPNQQVSVLLDAKPRLKGWGSKAPVFRRLMEEVRPKAVIEIGTFLGASAIHMARLGEALGLGTLILCVDDFRGWPGFTQKFDFIKQVNGDVMLLQNFMNNVVRSGFSTQIVPIPFSTSHTLHFFCTMGITADLIEVDAGHDFHSAWTDINLAYKALRPGGVMFGHDYYNKADKSGVQKAVQLFAQRNGLLVEPDGAHWILRSSAVNISKHNGSYADLTNGFPGSQPLI